MMDQLHSMTGTGVKYLLKMRELDPARKGFHCVAVAELLGVSKPSVHRMMDRLQERGLVQKDRYGLVYFTETGWKLAVLYGSYFDILYRYFCNILPEEDITAAVYTLLAEMSEKGIAALCKRISEKNEKNL